MRIADFGLRNVRVRRAAFGAGWWFSGDPEGSVIRIADFGLRNVRVRRAAFGAGWWFSGDPEGSVIRIADFGLRNVGVRRAAFGAGWWFSGDPEERMIRIAERSVTRRVCSVVGLISFFLPSQVRDPMNSNRRTFTPKQKVGPSDPKIPTYKS